MVAFPETEPMTIKRIEVALRNKDMYLLQEAANKLHEKYHTGFEFHMLNELSQIKTYIETNDIPEGIKDVLCPTIDGILSAAGKDISEYKSDEEREKQKEALKKNYDYNFGDPTSDSVKSEAENTKTDAVEDVNEEENSFENHNPEEMAENIQSEASQNDENKQQSFDFSYSNEDKGEYGEEDNREEQYSQENYEVQYQDEQNAQQHFDTQYQELQTNEVKEDVFEETKVPEEQNAQEDIAIFYHVPQTKDFTFAIKEYRQKLNFINSNLYARQPVNILNKISSIMDLVDVKDDICKFLLGLSKKPCKKTFVTTSLNQNITNYLANNDVKFRIPMVLNTYCEDSSLDIIPMFGATNLFVCKKCGSMFLNTGSYLKVLSLGCLECDDTAYPSIYDTNGVECNPIFWHRAFSTMVNHKIWIIINPPATDENEAVMDFLKVAFKSSNPKKVYIVSKDNTYLNLINQYNQGDTIISSYDSLEGLYNDLINNQENI